MPYPPINLPVVEPRAYDFSTLSTFQQCPRLAYYRYWLGRTPTEVSYPLMFGNAYHAYRENLENLFLKNDRTEDEEAWTLFHGLALRVALDLYPEDPPLGHKKEFLTRTRLIETCEQAFAGWQIEKRQKRMVVIASEQAFELPLGRGDLVFGGKFDQLLEWNGQLWVRDFKTTSYMGKTYANQFEPNAQITGYTWAAQQLSGRRVAGVIIETVYNTKTKGPEHSMFLSTRTDFHISEWMDDIEATRAEVSQATTSGVFPKRTPACTMFGGCIFRECCSMTSWASREEWLLNHTVERRWDFAATEEED